MQEAERQRGRKGVKEEREEERERRRERERAQRQLNASKGVETSTCSQHSRWACAWACVCAADEGCAEACSASVIPSRLPRVGWWRGGRWRGSSGGRRRWRKTRSSSEWGGDEGVMG